MKAKYYIEYQLQIYQFLWWNILNYLYEPVQIIYTFTKRIKWNLYSKFKLNQKKIYRADSITKFSRVTKNSGQTYNKEIFPKKDPNLY